MGLSLSEKPLEERLSVLSEDTSFKLVNSLRQKNEKTRTSPYLKHELVYVITHYFEARNISFGEAGYEDAKAYLGTINKEPLKPVEKGQRTIGIPKEFVEKLDDFEKLYFFAGANMLKNQPVDIIDTAWDAYEVASVYIRAGIDNMAYMHNSIVERNVRKRKVTRGQRIETYKNYWSPPHSSQIRKRLLRASEIDKRQIERHQKRIQEFRELFEEEEQYSKLKEDHVSLDADRLLDDKIAVISERIAIMLDSTPLTLRKILAFEFGEEKLGGYAPYINGETCQQ